jgi:hypothetical protein
MNSSVLKLVILLPALCLSMAGSSAMGESNSKSNHLNHFALHICGRQSCVDARGEVAYMAKSESSLSAADVTVSVVSTATRSVPQQFKCASFSYDLKSEFLMCSNEQKSQTSYTIDSRNFVRSYPAL